MRNKINRSNHERVNDENHFMDELGIWLEASTKPTLDITHRCSSSPLDGECGRLLFENRRSAKVNGILVGSYGQDGTILTGVLNGFPRSLHAAWLVPVVKLKLEGGVYLQISITEICGRRAKFETVMLDASLSL